jgi:hypothetical protein
MPTVTAKKQVTKCSQEVERIPLEAFRLPKDGRKWKQSARSRSALLLRLSIKANPDGTFAGNEGQNYARSFETLVLKSNHLSRCSYTRLTNALRDLGLLSWTRKNHYERREYTIHLPEHSQDSPKQYPDSKGELAKDSENQYLHSPESVSILDVETQNQYLYSSKSVSTSMPIPSLPTKERADKDFPTQTKPLASLSTPSAQVKGAGKMIQKQDAPAQPRMRTVTCWTCGDDRLVGTTCETCSQAPVPVGKI